MKAYVCVYRRSIPKRRHWEATLEAAKSDPILEQFLADYFGGWFDWGDDPGFHAAQSLLGDVRAASWGVCRPDVRGWLDQGDLVVFFCVRQLVQGRGQYVDPLPHWDYFYVGFGTVDEALDRHLLWDDERYRAYTRFYNTLVRPLDGQMVQWEAFRPSHANWQHRSRQPYILFSRDAELTDFNLTDPLHVASYDPTWGLPERWDTDDLPSRLERVLFVNRGIIRRLRTSHIRTSHPHINLHLRTGEDGVNLRAAVRGVLEEARQGAGPRSQSTSP